LNPHPLTRTSCRSQRRSSARASLETEGAHRPQSQGGLRCKFTLTPSSFRRRVVCWCDGFSRSTGRLPMLRLRSASASGRFIAGWLAGGVEIGGLVPQTRAPTRDFHGRDRPRRNAIVAVQSLIRPPIRQRRESCPRSPSAPKRSRNPRRHALIAHDRLYNTVTKIADRLIADGSGA
jgi:hypothetical protein